MRFRIHRGLKRALFGVVGAGVLMAGLSACAHRHESAWGGPMGEEKMAEFRGRMVEKVGKRLDLNDSQKQLLAALTDKLQEQRKALMGSNVDPRAEVQALVAGAKFDRSRAQTLVEEKTTAVRSKSPEVIAAAADFFDALNPAQQQQVRDLMQHRRGWRG